MLLRSLLVPATVPLSGHVPARIAVPDRDLTASAGLYDDGMVMRKADTPQLARRRTSAADALLVHADLIAAIHG
jgi:hypothetical protein